MFSQPAVTGWFQLSGYQVQWKSGIQDWAITRQFATTSNPFTLSVSIGLHLGIQRRRPKPATELHRQLLSGTGGTATTA